MDNRFERFTGGIVGFIYTLIFSSLVNIFGIFLFFSGRLATPNILYTLACLSQNIVFVLVNIRLLFLVKNKAHSSPRKVRRWLVFLLFFSLPDLIKANYWATSNGTWDIFESYFVWIGFIVGITILLIWLSYFKNSKKIAAHYHLENYVDKGEESLKIDESL